MVCIELFSIWSVYRLSISIVRSLLWLILSSISSRCELLIPPRSFYKSRYWSSANILNDLGVAHEYNYSKTNGMFWCETRKYSRDPEVKRYSSNALRKTRHSGLKNVYEYMYDHITRQIMIEMRIQLCLFLILKTQIFNWYSCWK